MTDIKIYNGCDVANSSVVLLGDHNSLKADLLESYKAIVDKCIQDEGDYGECIYCGNGGWGYPDKHEPYCIVNKAQRYIKEHE